MKNRKFCLLLVISWFHCVFGDDPQVETNFGPVRGVWLKTARGANITGYLGIPYAEPPIKELRFENPVPWTEKWTEVRNATSDGSKCLQLSDTGLVGDEDCLYLNVFTPTISPNGNETQQKKLSVLLFIHGGAFNTGSSNSSLYAPTYLLDHEIILVTLNYRLNILGFFSTGNSVAPGNYGLKDAAMALVWVHDNIEAFGGDPNSVTLMGQSSGAVMVHLLASSEATKGQFQKMITMSGAPTAKWAVHTRENIRNSSLHVAYLLECAHESDFDDMGSGDGENGTVVEDEDVTVRQEKIDRKIMQCMKSASPADIVMMSYFHMWRRNPKCIYGPTLEADAEGAILTVNPERSLTDGLFRDMPWINGVVDDEGLLKTTDLLLNSAIKDEFLRDFDTLLPSVLELQDSIENITEFSDAIKDFYFDGDILRNIESNITQMVGDALITFSSYDFLQRRLPQMKSKVYFYVLAYEGTFSTTFRWGIPFRFGAAHGDDLNYIFPYLNEKYADLQLFNTMGDRTMINIMSEMWINFAKTGVPSARLTSSWEPFQEHRRFMRFGDGRSIDRAMEQDFLTERMDFWRDLMGNYSLPILEYRAGQPVEEDAVAAAAGIGFTRITLCLALLSRWFLR
ncbi:esterase FE4 [Nasonia vitripennis]|uniref:Carboxylic ester hydrolase n=1 Tax=Nasonia vitripennis TaxID=7425 RepID=A0A7M7PU20_NASVI|nr:esterase FE4 [Nasonia vitripennis]XP_031776974.1 esterase FE4 [Nasonia vitripennis]